MTTSSRTVTERFLGQTENKEIIGVMRLAIYIFENLNICHVNHLILTLLRTGIFKIGEFGSQLWSKVDQSCQGNARYFLVPCPLSQSRVV